MQHEPIQLRDDTLTMRPGRGQVLVRLDPPEGMYHGLLVIPEECQERTTTAGEVVRLGPQAWKDGARVPMDVVVGERVRVTEYNGFEVEQGGHRYLILREDQILGVEEP